MSQPPFTGPSYVPNDLPPGAAEYLQAANPKLLELRQRYAGYRAFQHTQWAPEVLRHELELKYFRGDNAYNWQVRGGMQEAQYVMTAYYALSVDRLGLFDLVTEDSLFGAYTFDFNHRYTLSRDLLDSILQINFLDRHVNLSRMTDPTVLDIGAGYGRLAWRLSRGLPNLGRVWSADAIPESTFLCDYYLRFRGAGEKSLVIELDRVEAALRGARIDIVTNIQSFTECSLESIRWWLDILSRARVSYVLIVPNTPDRLLSMEPDGSRLDFQPLLESYGYRLIVKEPVYHGAPSAEKFGVYGGGKLWLFENV